MRSMRIVLASGSPRRKRLLGKIVEKFSVKPANTGERMHHGEPFALACARLAKAKAEKIARQEKNAVVIGADTIAYRRRKAYRKTMSRRAARSMLLELRGKTHFVVTGVAVVFPGGKTVNYSVRAAVRVRKFGKEELEGYIRTGEWKGRAGCYDISGRGRTLVESVRGEFETVVGLPLKRLGRLLNGRKRTLLQ